MIDLLMKLYPKAWRARYEDEFRALLEDTGCTPGAATNVAVNALLIQIRCRRMMLATIAFLALAAALDAYAVFTGLSDNILWLPRGPASSIILMTLIGCLAMAARPLAVTVRRRFRHP